MVGMPALSRERSVKATAHRSPALLHAWLREAMELVAQLARATLAGESAPSMRGRIPRLAELFRAHNTREKSLMTEALQTGLNWSRERIRQTLSAHLQEHDLLQAAIDSAAGPELSERERADIVLAVVVALELHIQEEEASGFFASAHHQVRKRVCC
jgi:hypothetical protein